jgi:hypothetical protein
MNTGIESSASPGHQPANVPPTPKLRLNGQHIVSHSDGLHEMAMGPVVLELEPDELATLHCGTSPGIFSGQRSSRDKLLVKDGIANEFFQ